MFRSHFCRTPHALFRVGKLYASTSSQKKSLLANYGNIIRRNLDFTGIFGPTADELNFSKERLEILTTSLRPQPLPHTPSGPLLIVGRIVNPRSQPASCNVVLVTDLYKYWVLKLTFVAFATNVNFTANLEYEGSEFGNWNTFQFHTLKCIPLVTKDMEFSNKTCLITGANSGIGLEMTRCLTSKNCNVIMACRNTYVADVVARNVCGVTDRLKLYKINLASLASVKKCADDIVKNIPKLDIVILNAGVFGLPWTLTEDSFETTFQVNYLSHCYLLLSIEKILATNARVVIVASESHRYVRWPFSWQLTPTREMLSLPKHEYTSIRAYNTSKLCSILFMHYLGYRWLNSGKSVFSAHPGSFVKTRLCRNWWPYETLYTVMKPFSKSISQAAGTPLYCATSPDLNGLTDQYYKDLRQCEESDLAKDLQLSFRVYDLTHELLLEHDMAREQAAVEDDKGQAYTERTKPVLDDSTLVADYSG